MADRFEEGSLADAFEAAMFSAPVYEGGYQNSMERIEAILATPEMQAIRTALRRLSGTSNKVSPRTMLRRAGLPKNVVRWVFDA